MIPVIDVTTLIDNNRSNQHKGLPCFCTANEHVLNACMQYAATHDVPAVIEATCNQVNQDGGYTGLTAASYAQWIAKLADKHGVPMENIVLGGDHLGPNPWRQLSADVAMRKAEVLVRDYAAAGYRKIHLDTSMACGGEPNPSFELIAERAARLCTIAEDSAPEPENLIYIIGTEVPIPGGETDDMDDLSVTSAIRLQDTIDTHRHAFDREGLSAVWPRIAAIVTQPGVDFSHTAVHRFQPDVSADLTAAIRRVPSLCYEAHSTDYQPTDALAELVDGHFFFLKVGPELTFRMREAVFALAHIENLLELKNPSQLISVIDKAMDEDSTHWAGYYQGDFQSVKQLRHYSYSDRIRYYWTVPEVRAAVLKMISNLDEHTIPQTLVSQYFPARPFEKLTAKPTELIADHVSLCIERYYTACGWH